MGQDIPFQLISLEQTLTYISYNSRRLLTAVTSLVHEEYSKALCGRKVALQRPMKLCYKVSSEDR